MGIGSNLFFSILKGGSKAEIIKEVKQNGNYVTSVMERVIRNAQDASCDDPANTEEWVEIISPNDQITTFECFDIGAENGRIASNSARLTSENVKVDACSITCEGTLPEVVTVAFTLSQKGTPSRVEERTTANFQTKVSLRTYD